MHPADRASGIIPDTEGWCEQADTHGKDDDHGVVHFMNADLLGDGEQQRTEQNNRRDAFENASQHDERGHRNQQEGRDAPRKPGHGTGKIT